MGRPGSRRLAHRDRGTAPGRKVRCPPEEAAISKTIESNPVPEPAARPPLRAASAPFARLLYWIARLPYRASDQPGPGAHKVVVRGWYQFLSLMDRRASMILMNYGYAPLDPGAAVPALRPEDEKDRYCIQLYHHVASACDLRGKDVLEVGCGRGGGASYVARY